MSLAGLYFFVELDFVTSSLYCFLSKHHHHESNLIACREKIHPVIMDEVKAEVQVELKVELKAEVNTCIFIYM
jgi:hypothetical protein